MNNIMAFGRNSFLTWPEGLAERVEREDKMTEPNYICNLCGRTFYCHPEFDELVCLCGNSDIKEFDEDEYNKTMAEADWDEWQEDRRLYGN